MKLNFLSLMSCHFYLFFFSFFLLASYPSVVVAAVDECGEESTHGCYDRSKALWLKFVAIGTILGASMIGVCSPFFFQSLPIFHPDGNIFIIVKAFASGVILATGYMHVLPDSFNDLNSPCLPDHPWRDFPFTTFVAMISAIFTLMVDSFMMSVYNRKCCAHHEVDQDPEVVKRTVELENEEGARPPLIFHGHGHGQGHNHEVMHSQEMRDALEQEQKIKARGRKRVIAQVID